MKVLYTKTHIAHTKGLTILEVIVAAAAFMLFATAAIGVFSQSLSINRYSGQGIVANAFLNEGMDALRSIRDQNFGNLLVSNHGIQNGFQRLSFANNLWQMNGNGTDTLTVNNVTYTREVTIDCAMRSTQTQNIVAVGGDSDSCNLKKATVTVRWLTNSATTISHTSFVYFSNFRQEIITPPTCVNWAGGPHLAAVADLPDKYDGYKVVTEDAYAYVIRKTTNPPGTPSESFSVVDISNGTALNLSNTWLSGNPTAIFKAGSYVYIATDASDKELEIYEIVDPYAPTPAININGEPYFDVPGDAKINDIWVDPNGMYAYLARDADGMTGSQIVTLDISSPDWPVFVSSIGQNEGFFGNALAFASNASYGSLAVATDYTNGNMYQINIDASTLGHPTLTASYFLQTNGALITSLSSLNNILTAGTDDGTLYYLNISSPAIISQYSSLSIGGRIYGVASHTDFPCTFTAGTASLNTYESTVVDYAALFLPSEFNGVSGLDTQNDVAYNPTYDEIITVGNGDNQEVNVIVP